LSRLHRDRTEIAPRLQSSPAGAKFEIATIGTNFDGANLQGALFMNVAQIASFKGADLRKAKAEGADFTKADFHGADMTDMIVQNSDFNVANLACVKAEKAHFKWGNKLVKANFQHAWLKETTFEACLLSEAIFQDANLWGAQLMSGSDLTAADFTRATGVCEPETDMSTAMGEAKCVPIMAECQAHVVDPSKCS